MPRPSSPPPSPPRPWHVVWTPRRDRRCSAGDLGRQYRHARPHPGDRGDFLPAIIAHLALLLAPALGASLFGALLGARRTDMAVAPDVETSIPIGNPLDLGAALGLAAVVAAASLIGHWILDRFGDLTLGSCWPWSGCSTSTQRFSRSRDCPSAVSRRRPRPPPSPCRCF
ncbi:DUF4010 domain-containing protein [Rhizorhabdus histidinilytica]